MFEHSVKQANSLDLEQELKLCLKQEYSKAVEQNQGQHFTTAAELAEYYSDGVAILKYIQSHRAQFFATKNHQLVGVEIPLQVSLNQSLVFNGFIDLVIKDQRTGKIKIWDIKTSTRGWNKHQKKDVTKTAQLILYKQMYAKQFNVDPESVDVEYFIVRRKINQQADFVPKRVQTFSPASGKPTRNKISKLLDQFITECFDDSGDHKVAQQDLPAIQSSQCSSCSYGQSGMCLQKDRIKKK